MAHGEDSTPRDALVAVQSALPHYTPEACALCLRVHSPFGETLATVGCQLCGAAFHDDCYWRLAATSAERLAWERHGTLNLFVCRGCRA